MMSLSVLRRAFGPSVWTGCALLVSACGGTSDRSPALNLDDFCFDCNDGGPIVTPPVPDAGPALLDVDTWKGERVSFNVTPSRMVPPQFSAWPSDLIALSRPATVHFPYNKYDYTFVYDPTANPPVKTFTNVPKGAEGFAMVTDIDGGNGILNSIFPAITSGGSWSLPCTTFQSLDEIYASLGLVIDPSYAQVIVSLSTGVNGDLPVENATISTKNASMQTIIYDLPAGGFGSVTATGPLGLAIIVNMDAVGLEYPGKWFPLYVTVNGGVQPTVPQFPAARNAVTRLYFMQGGLEGGP